MNKPFSVLRGAILAALLVWLMTQPGISISALAAPSLTGIDPAAAPNDLDTPITLTGADFEVDSSDPLVVKQPTAFLGNVALTHVTWVNSTTLTASVPWGMNPGVYALSVVNPDGSAGSLANAFTITQGIGQWNGADLFGGYVHQVMMKPGDANTLFASAYGVGLFRSRDAGEHWTYVSADVAINNGKYAIDPLNSGWIYGYDFAGLQRTQDEGDSWSTIMANIWPDGRAVDHPQVYVSPYNEQVLFVSSYNELSEGYPVGNALGLIQSKDGGTTWSITADLEGIGVQDLAFHPSDPLGMVLVTQDARVFQSSDAGDHWGEVTKPTLNSMGFGGVITYNPYRPSEVWIASTTPSALLKSTDAAFTGWQSAAPADGAGSSVVKFTSADSVYITRHHSPDGGQTWQTYGPFAGYGEMVFDPLNAQIAYIGDDTYGIQKTSDGGQTWQVKNQGLTGMRCSALNVSSADPLRVYATFGDWPGIYRSTDGANHWTYLPIDGAVHVGLVREDPFNAQRLYAVADGFYVSGNAGEGWDDLGWNLPAPAVAGMPLALEPDPHQAGHVLVGMVYFPAVGGTGKVFSSSDYGVTWQATTFPAALPWISSIAFDPTTPGLVYLTAGGVYRSKDSGMTWERIDDPTNPEMKTVSGINIATHPQPMLLLHTAPNPYRSLDGGDTWERAKGAPAAVAYMFADRDSTRLYAATWMGLVFSSDAGDSWTQASGALGSLHISALGYATQNNQTILYAATTGGKVSSGGAASSGSTGALATKSRLVDAGIYRYVYHIQKMFLPVVRRGK